MRRMPNMPARDPRYQICSPGPCATRIHLYIDIYIYIYIYVYVHVHRCIDACTAIAIISGNSDSKEKQTQITGKGNAELIALNKILALKRL